VKKTCVRPPQYKITGNKANIAETPRNFTKQGIYKDIWNYNAGLKNYIVYKGYC